VSRAASAWRWPWYGVCAARAAAAWRRRSPRPRRSTRS
jgi:hypothetical protein